MMSGEKRQASDEPVSTQLVKRPNLGSDSSGALARFNASNEKSALVQSVSKPPSNYAVRWSNLFHLLF